MTFDHTRFANDLAGMPLRDLVRLYKHCLPHNLDLDAILQAIHQNGLEL